jgi:hypothetical protein
MKRVFAFAIFGLLAMPLGYAQSSTAPGSSPSDTSATTPAVAAHPDNEIRGAFPVTLAKALDSKKLKEGDGVVGQTAATLRSGSGLMIPVGAKVIGHVTQAEARSKGNPDSTLAIAFDKIELANGKELPMKGVLQAVGPSLRSDNGPDTGPAGGVGMGGHHGDAADTSTVPAGSNTAVAGPNSGIHSLGDNKSKPILNAQSQGVLGIKNLEMNKDSVLTSPAKEVKLETGTQLMVRAEINIPTE